MRLLFKLKILTAEGFIRDKELGAPVPEADKPKAAAEDAAEE